MYAIRSYYGTDYTLYWNDSTDNANWNEDIRVSVRRPNGTLIKDGLIDGPVTFTANYAEELSVELTASDGSLVGTRITSYNVCYTKLLRSKGQFNVSIEASSRDEIGDLATSFNTMASYNFV